MEHYLCGKGIRGGLYKYPSFNQVKYYGIGSSDSSKVRFFCSVCHGSHSKNFFSIQYVIVQLAHMTSQHALIFLWLVCVNAHSCRLYLEAGGPVEKLHHVSYAGFGGLGEPSLELLDHEQNQHLPGQG